MWTMNANWTNRYLEKLTSDKKEDEDYRKEFNLAKITEAEKDNIKASCQKIVKKYTNNLNKGKKVTMQSDKVKEENRDSNKAKKEYLANAA
jgi:hypothetical protein